MERIDAGPCGIGRRQQAEHDDQQEDDERRHGGAVARQPAQSRGPGATAPRLIATASVGHGRHAPAYCTQDWVTIQ